MWLGAFLFDTPFSKMTPKPDLTEYERTTINSLHTAKLFIKEIAKQLCRYCAAIRYNSDPKKYDKNHGGKINSNLLPQDRCKITIHAENGAMSASTVKTNLNIA